MRSRPTLLGLVFRCALGVAVAVLLAGAGLRAQVPGPNVNMISIDKYLQKQNEVDVAPSPMNPCHLVGAANDYRTVNNRGLNADGEIGDSWIGVYVSTDCGETWLNYIGPGYVQGLAAADPMPRFGPGGGLYISHITFSRGSNVGTVSVLRYRDYNDVEGVPGPPTAVEDQHNPAFSPVRYLGTTVWARGSAGQFLDKPSIAVAPGAAGATCAVEGGGTLPATRVYVAWTEFVSASDQVVRSKVYFARSTDCGRTLAGPATKLSEGVPINQGTVIAVNPTNSDEVYVAWRQVRDARNPDTVLFARSTDGGRSFTKPTPVMHLDGIAMPLQGVPYQPFDQFTTPTRFRTIGYPTMVMAENGRLYLAVSARIGQSRLQPDGTTLRDGRVVVTSTTDGASWEPPRVVEAADAEDGHQIMPAIAYAGGRLNLIWYDLRYDESDVFKGFVDESDVIGGPTGFRHTLDVRGAQAGISGGWPLSWNVYGVTEAVPADTKRKISQYLYGAVDPDDGEYKQRSFNRPNLKLYSGGGAPFMGDYIGTAGVQWLPTPGGGWAFNGAAAGGSNTVLRSFQAAWGDNRDAIVGEAGDTPGQVNSNLDYVAPGTPACVPGSAATKKANSRNANVYTSRITPGLYLSALGNTKPTNQIERAYALTVENGTEAAMTVRLTLTAPAGVAASFTQPSRGLPQQTQIDVAVGGLSSAAQTLYIPVTPSTPYPRVDVVAQQQPTGLRAALVINGDPTNPAPSQPGNTGDPIGTQDTHNPRVENPRVENQSTRTPRVENPRVENDNVKTPRVENPRVENPRVENPRVENPRVENEGLEAAPFSDVTFDFTNDGNTTSTFDLSVRAAPALSTSYAFQLFGWRAYQLPIERDCVLEFTEEPQVLFNVPTTLADDYLKAATAVVRPGETIKLTLRAFDRNTADGFQPFCSDEASCGARVFVRAAAQAGNVVLGQPTAPPAEDTFGTTTPLPDLTIAGTLTATPAVAGLGSIIDVSALSLQNIGAADATTDFGWGYYLSTDPVITPSDILLSIGGVGSLAAGSALALPATTLTVPITLPGPDPVPMPAGAFYVGVLADDQLTIGEGNEANNAVVAATPITVVPYQASFSLQPPESVLLGTTFPVTVVVTDRNGVAIPGATVTLSVAPATGTLTPAGPTAVTGDGGSATFTGLGVSPLGSYRIVATVSIPGVGSFRAQSQQFQVYQLL